jgi:hypothetical protein
MTSVDQSQLERVAQVLGAHRVKTECPACGQGKLALSRHLVGLPEFVSSLVRDSQGAGTLAPTGET